MKKVILVLLFSAVGIARAGAIEAIPLKGVAFCANNAQVLIDDNTKSWLGDLTLKLKTQVDDRLQAYRIPKSDCLGSNEAFAQVLVSSTKPIGSGYYGYVVTLQVLQVTPQAGIITLWNDYTLGVSNDTAQSTTNTMYQSFGRSIDRMAADYSLANP